MQVQVPEWVLHLISVVIGFGGGFLFFVLQLRIDFKKIMDKITELNLSINQFVPFLRRKLELDSYVPASPMEEKLINFVDKHYERTRNRLCSDKTIQIFDFDEGWRLLFTEFFSGRPGILRDVTFSSHGDTSFQKYDFASYPLLVGEYVEKFKDKTQAHEVRFMMVCSPSKGEGENNKQAEKFLRSLLEIKYPHCTEPEKLFDRWASNDQGDRPAVQIMITNDNILRKVVGLAAFDSPFNVYGDLAVSRSIVRGATADKPLPHLEVWVDQDEIERSSRLFDSVWNASIILRTRALGKMSEDQKKQLAKAWSFKIGRATTSELRATRPIGNSVGEASCSGNFHSA